MVNVACGDWSDIGTGELERALCKALAALRF